MVAEALLCAVNAAVSATIKEAFELAMVPLPVNAATRLEMDLKLALDTVPLPVKPAVNDVINDIAALETLPLPVKFADKAFPIDSDVTDSVLVPLAVLQINPPAFGDKCQADS